MASTQPTDKRLEGRAAAYSPIPFIDPATGRELVRAGDYFVHPESMKPIAPIVDGIARFVDSFDDYAESFGWQWNHWADTLSDSRLTGDTKYELLRDRTQFEEFDMDGKTILECGMGGGDDTEVLLGWPFREVHAFDLSRSVDRARQFLKDPRLTISQASILDIPYADKSFDFVFCHRVL
jgi:hypothetical protein